MPKPDHKKPHPKGIGAKLVAPATDFIERFVSSPKDGTWATEQVTNEGPEHKQVLNAVLLQQLAELVKAIEAKTGKQLQLQPGETITSHKHDEETDIPVPFPLEWVPTKNKEAILETIAKAPEHEVLVYAMLQQVATWGTKVLTTSN
jgi:hypothetical protein